MKRYVKCLYIVKHLKPDLTVGKIYEVIKTTNENEFISIKDDNGNDAMYRLNIPNYIWFFDVTDEVRESKIDSILS